MAYPDKPTLDYSYTGFQQAQGDDSFPGTQVDNDLANLKEAIDETIDFLENIERSDGALKNGIVTVDSLSTAVAAMIGDDAALALVQAAVDAMAADVVLTHADVVLTHADVVLTHADVVLTHADVVTTHADVTAVAAALTAASGTNLISGTPSAGQIFQFISATQGEGVNGLDAAYTNSTITSGTIAASQKGEWHTIAGSGANARTLPQAAGPFTTGWNIIIQYIGADTLTITPTTSTINGLASLVLRPNDVAMLVSDGVNYWAIIVPGWLTGLPTGAFLIGGGSTSTPTYQGAGTGVLAAVGNNINSSGGLVTYGNVSTAMFAANVADTDGTLAANSDTRFATQKAVKTYADALIAAADAMVFKGVIDCSGNPNYPAGNRGESYRVSVAGKIGGASGTNVEAGDLLICLTDSTASGTQAGVGASWTIAQTNLDGAVIGPSSVTDAVPVLFDGTTGKLIKATTFSAFKTSLGLGSVDNTADSAKSVASAATLTTARNIFGFSFDGSAVLSGIITSVYGGTGNGFTKFSGPASTEKTFTLPNASASLAALDVASQALTGGVLVTAASLSTGNITVNCGTCPLQKITNGGAFTITAPAADGSCMLMVTNNGSAGAITFSGFTVGSNTGDPLDTTNAHIFTISIWRINGVSGYRVAGHQ